MTWRRALAYWACFLVLGAYYLLVLRESARPTPPHLTRAPFLNLAESDVESMELRRGTEIIRCRRVDGRWQVVEPAGGTVPSDLVAALVANLTQLPDVEVVDEGSGDIAQFGLAPPVSQITLTRTSGQPISVRFGSRNPSGTAIYAQHGDGRRVYLIGLNVRYYEDLVFQAAAPQPRNSAPG
jgi:hypothetical protein